MISVYLLLDFNKVICVASLCFALLKTKTCSQFEVANTFFVFRGYKQVESDFLVFCLWRSIAGCVTDETFKRAR